MTTQEPVEEAAQWLYTADRDYGGIGKSDGPTWDTDTDDTRAYWRELAAALARRGLLPLGSPVTEWGVRWLWGVVDVRASKDGARQLIDSERDFTGTLVSRTAIRTEWREVKEGSPGSPPTRRNRL